MDKLDMPLDDLIAKGTKKKQGGQRQRRARNSDTGPDGNSNPLSRGSNSGPTRNRYSGRSRDGPYSRRGGGRQQNDQYEEPNHWAAERARNRGQRGGTQVQVSMGGNSNATKIVVKNLDPSVDEDDVESIFSSEYPVQSVSMNYNRDGTSKGNAEVIFVNAGDANKAHQDFNEAEVDGRPMYIEVVDGQSTRSGRQVVKRNAAAGKASVFGGNMNNRDAYDQRRGGFERRERRERPRGRQGGRGGRGGANKGNGGGRSRNNKPAGGRRNGGAGRAGGRKKGGEKKEYTAEELDAMMDSYRGGKAGEDSGNAAEASAEAAAPQEE